MTDAEKQATLDWCDMVHRSPRATSAELNVARGLRQLLDENATLKERIDEVKMQYEGVKLVNIELQSKLNGYKVIYDSLNERYVRVLKDFSSANNLNASLVAMLEKIGGYARHDEGCNYPFNPAYGCKCLLVDASVELGNLLKEVREKK